MNTLMYIEDDEALASVTTRALSRRNFEITHYSDLKGAQQDTQRNYYTHALLDLRLEDGNSLEIIEEIITRHPEIKALVLTGYASIATAVQSIKKGAINYLAKPATAEQIVNAFEDSDAADELMDVPEEQLSLKRMEWEHIQQALADNDGNISAAARQLKMHRRTLQRKLAKKPSQF